MYYTLAGTCLIREVLQLAAEPDCTERPSWWSATVYNTSQSLVKQNTLYQVAIPGALC